MKRIAAWLGALLLVLLRMVWVGADKSCPREFFFLLSLLCYALLSFAPSFPPGDTPPSGSPRRPCL